MTLNALLLLFALLLADVSQAEETVRIILPPQLPAACIGQAAADYALPPEILIAMIKTESGGRSVVSRNANGSMDYGVAQHNTASWVPYFEKRYNIPRQSLIDTPCQSIRAQAYALRSELNHRECGGVDLWCAVGRYHSPGNMANRAVYVPKVKAALSTMLSTGRFESSPSRSAPGREAATSQPGAPSGIENHQTSVSQRIEFSE